MPKHTYGFPANTNRAQAIASALEQATADGFITGPDAASTEIIQSDEHRNSMSVRFKDGHNLRCNHAAGYDLARCYETETHSEFVVVVRPAGANIG